MTGPARRRPGDGSQELRRALDQAASRLPEPPSMVGAVHALARRKRRRRNAVAGGGAALAVTAVVVATVGGLPLAGGQGAPAARATPPPVTATGGTTRASGTQAAPPATALVPPAATRRPPAPAGADADDFTGTALDRDRWTFVYDGGPSSPLATWSAGDVAVGGGTLRLSVSRAGPAATSGGVGAAGSAAATGRWEVRWRMTDGLGVVGQLALVTAGTEGSAVPPPHLATLEPARDRVVFLDTASGRTHAAAVDAGAFHTVAAELTRDEVRWLVDGREAVAWPRAAAQPVWPALQALLAGPDCGAVPLPADCPAATGFPQRLDVDRFRYDRA